MYGGQRGPDSSAGDQLSGGNQLNIKGVISKPRSNDDIVPFGSGETDSGSIFVKDDSADISESRDLYEGRVSSWEKGSATKQVMVDQVLSQGFSTDFADDAEAAAWKEQNFDFQFHQQQKQQPRSSQPSESSFGFVNTRANREIQVFDSALGATQQKGRPFQSDNAAIELGQRFSNLSVDYGSRGFPPKAERDVIQKQALPPSRFAASQRNVYQQPYSQPPGNALQYPPQTLPQQRGIPPQQPMSQQQIQSMLASGQAQYMMIPGLGLTLVPIMQLSHPPPALPVNYVPPAPSFAQGSYSQGQQMQPSYHPGYSTPYMPPSSKAAHKATAMTLAVMAMRSSDGLVYLVHFKHSHRNFILSPSARKNIPLGEFVIVEADRGEDIGIVVEIVPAYTFVDDKHTAGYRGKGFATDQQGEIRKILRIASEEERDLLPDKAAEEAAVVEVCREKVDYQFQLPITVLDAEYQLDRHKLTIYYEAQRRIDFRDLVRDLFALYKTRIWMAQIDSSFEPNLPASVSLLTGKHPESYEGGEGGQSRADSGGILPLTSDAARYTSPSKDAGDSAGNDFGSWQNY